MKKCSLVGVWLFIFWLAGQGETSIFLQITQNLTRKAPVSILLGQPRNEFWEKFARVFTQDTEYSDCFSVQECSFILPERLAAEKNTRVNSLVFTSSQVRDKTTFAIEDPGEHQTLWSKDYQTPEEARSFAHQVADDLVLALTGRPGIASTKIAYVSDRTASYQIYSIDADGENERQLTSAAFMVHYPRWLPGKRNLLLVSYEYGWPKLAKFDLVSRNLTTLLAEPGLNACASFCRATDEIALVLSRSGNPEIYLFSEKNKSLKQLTYDRGVDSSPSMAPDGQTLAFVSDRQGKPQIFLMNREGFQVRRISYISSYCTSPAWSPDGSLIAYVFSRGGSFGVAVYEVNTRRTIIVDENAGAEDVSWAPDSRHLVYTRSRTKPAVLEILDVITRNKRQLTSSRF
ncbi:MAG: hypothetical protein NC911_10435, partial [Candidatus Omnitrophica bacterium]|nr:hypothetical protein [Candidatus Omnitrophota bacterium]